jgi:hypothetical protein
MKTRAIRSLALASVLLVGLTITMVVAQGMSEGPPDYRSWTRLNPQPNFIESAHPTVKDVFVNEAGSEAATTRSFPFPEGSELVKASMNEDLTVFVVTAMRKVAGFDPDNGDWEYGMFERGSDGAFEGMWAEVGSDMHMMCVSCHTGAAANDFVFLSYTGD